MPMYNAWVEEYVQQRVIQARKELQASERAAINKQAGSSSIDRIADRVASKVKPATQQRQQAGGYIARPESSKPGFQGMYSDELFRLSGLYEREWKRLHGDQ